MNGDRPVLPKKSKSKGRKPLLFVGIGAGAAVAIAVTILVIQANTPVRNICEPKARWSCGRHEHARICNKYRFTAANKYQT
jgi:hypothetical protein